MRIWQKLKCSDGRIIFFFHTENLKLTFLIEADLPNCYIKLLDKTKLGEIPRTLEDRLRIHMVFDNVK